MSESPYTGKDRRVALPHFPAGHMGPRTTTLVASCAIALTGKALGLDWLSHPVFGVPAGMWGVGIAMLFAQYRHQRLLEQRAGAGGLLSTRLEVPRLSVDAFRSHLPPLPTSDQITGILEMVGVPAKSWDNARKQLNTLGSRVAHTPPATAIRIGIDLCEADRRAIMAAGRDEAAAKAPGVEIEWVKAPSGLITDAERDLAGLDCLIRRERRGDINIVVPEHPDRPAAWYDWSGPVPLSYASVFPPRVDAARVTLSACEPTDANAGRCLAQMALAAAMLGRTLPRVGAGRRLFGRAEMPRLSTPGGPLDSVMMHLGETVRRVATGSRVCAPYLKTAARVVSAWMVRSECGVGEEPRAGAAMTAAKVLFDEPEAQLRAASLQFAAGDSDAGLMLMGRACEMLRASGRRCESDPLAFIMSEVEHGEPGRVTLGRIAAGIGLLWATSPESNLAYLRDDLMDDLSHAGWLSERAGDVQLLQGVVDHLQRQTHGTPASRARAA